MRAQPQGVYEDGRGRWYFKVTLGRDPLTGKHYADNYVRPLLGNRKVRDVTPDVVLA